MKSRTVVRSPTAEPVPAEDLSQPLLRVELRAQGTTRVVVVAGEMDISSVVDVRPVIDRALNDRPETLLLDLTQLAFCDSTGVHLVVHTHRRAAVLETRLLVLPPTGPARRVFDICRIQDHVTFIGEDDAAVHAGR